MEKNGAQPLYLQIKNDILQAIESGKIRVGDKLMSENEMLRHYGVGRMTVRSALAELVAEGCIKKEQGLGSFCVGLPRKERRLNIDVLVNSGDTYFVPYLLKGISEVLEKNNCNLLLHDTRNSAAQTAKLLRDIRANGPDGVLLQHPSFGSEEEWLQLRQSLTLCQAGTPLLMMLGGEGLPCTASLTIDDSYGARTAARYLLDCGHRRILGLFHRPEFYSKARVDAMQEVFGSRADVQLFMIEGEQPYEPELLQLLRREKITAIQCYNDRLAAECIRLLAENGYRVPEDLSVIGYDNTELSMHTVPPMTTVSHPKDHLGYDAAQMLLTIIRSGESAGQGDVLYRPELVIRRSVRDLTKQGGKA